MSLHLSEQSSATQVPLSQNECTTAGCTYPQHLDRGWSAGFCCKTCEKRVGCKKYFGDWRQHGKFCTGHQLGLVQPPAPSPVQPRGEAAASAGELSSQPAVKAEGKVVTLPEEKKSVSEVSATLEKKEKAVARKRPWIVPEEEKSVSEVSVTCYGVRVGAGTAVAAASTSAPAQPFLAAGATAVEATEEPPRRFKSPTPPPPPFRLKPRYIPVVPTAEERRLHTIPTPPSPPSLSSSPPRGTPSPCTPPTRASVLTSAPWHNRSWSWPPAVSCRGSDLSGKAGTTQFLTEKDFGLMETDGASAAAGPVASDSKDEQYVPTELGDTPRSDTTTEPGSHMWMVPSS